MLSEEHKKKISEGMKKKWQDQEYRKKCEKHLKGQLKKNWENSEYRAKLIPHLKEIGFIKGGDNPTSDNWKNSEYRKKISKARKKQWQDKREIMLETLVNARKERWKKNISVENI